LRGYVLASLSAIPYPKYKSSITNLTSLDAGLYCFKVVSPELRKKQADREVLDERQY
jgi:hypothetical protein